jgi:ATP-dependent RNA helicase RhlE
VTISNFSEIGLADPIQRALTSRKHTIPTPIQAQAIPDLLKGRDMLGIAQTGTGKTAAFALPILHLLSQARTHDGATNGGDKNAKNRNHNKAHKAARSPRALVLAPTRELAIQIGEEFRAYSKHLALRQTVIFGGVSQKPQVAALVRGLDILVATPGRLLDLMGQRHVRLDAIEFLVLDEADRMLDMGFVHDVRKIMATMPAKRQSLLFSATMPKEISRLSAEILTDPMRVEVTPQATPIDRIEQNIYHVSTAGKKALLDTILKDPALSRVIVFARTKHRANRVAEQLGKGGVAAEAIHGNKSQGARQRALQRFRDGQARVLVATDIAARGIDVDSVSHVINYELPNEPENYVHRIGRTARAGAAGVAIAFCDPAERAYLSDIEKLIKRPLTVIGDAPGPMDPKLASPDQRGRGRPRGNGQARKASNGSGPKKGPPGKSRNRSRNRSRSTGGGGVAQKAA